MEAVRFPQANLLLVRGETHPEDTGDLYVYTDREVMISCWQPTEEERRAIAEGGPVWLSVLTGLGKSQPPVAVTAEDPFAEVSNPT